MNYSNFEKEITSKSIHQRYRDNKLVEYMIFVYCVTSENVLIVDIFWYIILKDDNEPC